MLVKTYQNPSNMSIPRKVRTEETASVWEVVGFENIDPGFLRNYPLDTNRRVSILTNPTIRLFEAITPNSSKDHKTWKPFEHYKAQTNHAHGLSSGGVVITADLYAGSGLLSKARVFNDAFFNRSTEFGPPGQYNEGLTAWYVPRSDGGFIPVPSNIESLKLRGLKAMMPKIKADLSSLVSLYEIKDIVSIRGTLKNLASMAKLVASKVGGSSRPIGKVVARGVADGYLQYMFNLKPLISDIGGIYRAVATYERRLNDLVSRSGKTQLTHFMCPLGEQLGVVAEPWGSYKTISGLSSGICFEDGQARYLYSSVKLQRTTSTDSAVFRSCMQYNYLFSAFQLEHSKVLGLLDALGVNFNPSYIWNVVPWSFVIDWVVNVSSWLDQFEVKNMGPKINILQYCWSIKKTRSISIRGSVRSSVSYSSPGFYTPQYIRFPDVRETSYRRGTDFPSTSSFTTSGLSSTELSLGAALITTRRRRNTRRGYSLS